jgi:hypothetical protein
MKTGLFARPIHNQPLVAERVAIHTIGVSKVEGESKLSRLFGTILTGLLDALGEKAPNANLWLTGMIARACDERRRLWLQLVGASTDTSRQVAERLVPTATDGVADLADGQVCHLCHTGLYGTIVSCRRAHAHRTCAVRHWSNILSEVYSDEVVTCPCGCGACVITELSAYVCP